MNNFKPTFIYIKTCNHCGLKYLGKSCKKTRKQVHKYNGSGIYWSRHLKNHGEDFRTDIINYFEDKDFCKYFCIQFSKENDIVKSKKWANLCEEDGIGGGDLYSCQSEEYKRRFKIRSSLLHKGKKLSEKTKQKIRNANIGKKYSEATKQKLSRMRKGKKLSEETKQKLRVKAIGRTHTEETKKRLSLAHIGKKLSEEHKLKIGNYWKGKSRKYKKVKCPHCEKEGGVNNMTRYHFDNCKILNQN